MTPAFHAKSQRDGGNRALANTFDSNAELLDSTEALKALQARRLCDHIRCTQAMAFTLAHLAYGEGRL